MIQKDITIKTATHRDIDQLVPLLEQLFSIEKNFIFNETVQRRGLKLMLDGCGKHRVVKTAWMENKLVGMVTAQTRISTATGNITAILEDFVVDRKFRGKGVGTTLLNAIEQWAHKLGISRLTLLADLENQPGLVFYQRNRFKQTQLVCLYKEI